VLNWFVEGYTRRLQKQPSFFHGIKVNLDININSIYKITWSLQYFREKLELCEVILVSMILKNTWLRMPISVHRCNKASYIVNLV